MFCKTNISNVHSEKQNILEPVAPISDAMLLYHISCQEVFFESYLTRKKWIIYEEMHFAF